MFRICGGRNYLPRQSKMEKFVEKIADTYDVSVCSDVREGLRWRAKLSQGALRGPPQWQRVQYPCSASLACASESCVRCIMRACAFARSFGGARTGLCRTIAGGGRSFKSRTALYVACDIPCKMDFEFAMMCSLCTCACVLCFAICGGAGVNLVVSVTVLIRIHLLTLFIRIIYDSHVQPHHDNQ